MIRPAQPGSICPNFSPLKLIRDKEVALPAGSFLNSRTRKNEKMKIFGILYNDPKSGMPVSYPHNTLPNREEYADGMSLLSPKGIDFTLGRLLGYVSKELGLTKFLKYSGHKLKVTSDKDIEGPRAEKGLIRRRIGHPSTLLSLVPMR